MSNYADALDRKRKTWEKKVKQWQDSGKSAAAWCRENNETYCVFLYWKDKFVPAQKRNRLTTLNFIELTDEGSSKDAGIKICCQGISLQIEKDFDANSLTRVLSLLRKY